MPSLLTAAIMETCDRTLARVRETDRMTDPDAGPQNVGARFERFGASAWNELRTRFHDSEAAE